MSTWLLQKENTRRLTKRGMLQIKNVALLIETTLQAPATINLKSMVVQKTSVVTANSKVMMWHGTHALITILDTQTIISPWASQPTILETSPLVIMTNIITIAIIVALWAALVTNMITEIATASQQLMTAKAKITMPNPTTNLDQEHNCDQGPVLVIL